MAAPAGAIISEQLPGTSHPGQEPLETPVMALAADEPSGGSAEGAGMTQLPTEGGQACTANAGKLIGPAEEIAWLRRTLESALRALQAAGGQLPEVAAQRQHPCLQSAPAMHSPTRGPCTPSAQTKEIVFLGLPLAAGASNSDASLAVQQFCTEKLQLPDFRSTDISHMSMCRAQNGSFARLRPSTLVVAKMDAQQAAAIFQAKRVRLDGTCLVSIDWQRSPEERRCRQAQRLLRRQVGQDGGRAASDTRQQGEAEGAVEGDVAALH